MLGSDILRGSGDSFGDIPVCDSMTNLCLYLILESTETARRTAVWGCRAPVCRRVCSCPLYPASTMRHQDQCPGRGDTHVKAETALLQRWGLVVWSPIDSIMWEHWLERKCMFYHYTSSQLGLKRKKKRKERGREEKRRKKERTKERTSQFWILARLASSKEPVYSNTDLPLFVF